MKLYVRGLQGALGMKMQLMESAEADFSAGTWTFKAPSFVVSGGEYLIISKRDWMDFWDEAYGCESKASRDPTRAPTDG